MVKRVSKQGKKNYRDYKKNKLDYLKLKQINNSVRAISKKTTSDHIQPVPRAPYRNTATYSLRYVAVVGLTSVSGAIVTYNFCANGIYDPDTSGLGHQPLFRDTVASMYNHYDVLSSKIQVFTNSQATSNVADNMICAVTLDDDGVTATDLYAVLEGPRCKWKLCTHSPMYNDVMGLNKPITMRYNAKSFFGKDRAGDDSTSSVVGDNPTDKAYFSINVASWPGTANNDTLQVTVVIDYRVKFSEPQTIEAS